MQKYIYYDILHRMARTYSAGFFSSTNIDSVETTIHPAVDNVLVDRKNVILDSTIIQVELVIQAVVVVSIKE